jgi:hypothetical protein
MSIRTKNYDGYLGLYGHVYGDMSDPVKRAETIAALRRRDALTLAAARRQVRAEISRYETDELISETRGYVWLTTSEDAKRYRYQGASHLRKVDLHQLRMLRNECKRRGIEL